MPKSGRMRVLYRRREACRPSARCQVGTLRALGHSVASFSGQMVFRLHRGLSEGRALTPIDPATRAGIAAGMADREPLDGVCSQGTERVIRGTALAEIA